MQLSNAKLNRTITPFIQIRSLNGICFFDNPNHLHTFRAKSSIRPKTQQERKQHFHNTNQKGATFHHICILMDPFGNVHHFAQQLHALHYPFVDSMLRSDVHRA